jgi:hypothetical protein
MYPSRMGEKWSEYETNGLFAELKEGKSLPELATLHQRTPNSIKARIAPKIEEMTRSGMKAADVLSELGISEAEQYKYFGVESLQKTQVSDDLLALVREQGEQRKIEMNELKEMMNELKEMMRCISDCNVPPFNSWI